MDERIKYSVHFEVAGHRHDGLFLSLEEVEAFLATYIVKHELQARDVGVSDSFRNRRGWKSISRKDVKLNEPWISVSTAASIFLSRYIEIVLGVGNLERVKLSQDGNVFLEDPAPDCPDRHRMLGTVDGMLRDFVSRWNASVDRAFQSEADQDPAPASDKPTAASTTPGSTT
jgi:hypothetical protein